MRQTILFVISLCLLLSITFCPGANAAEPGGKESSKNVNSNRICTDTTGGAWDWSNWQDVVADCKVYVFRKRMISKR